MKFRQTPLLNVLVLSLGIVGTTGTLFVHTAHAADSTWQGPGTDLNTARNWTAGLPTDNGNTATWNGTQSGNLSLSWSTSFGSSPNGTNLNITGAQVGNLLLGGTSGTLAVGNITIANGAGAFNLGDGVGSDSTVFRNPGDVTTNTLTNDSGNTATFASNVVFNSGAGVGRSLVFAGSGNWAVNGNLVPGGLGSFAVTKNGAGTLTFAAATTYTGTTTINEGTLAFTAATTSNLAGGLTFGATAGSSTTSALDLSTSSATFGGATLVQTNSATANTISIGSGKTLTLNNNVTIGANVGGTATKLTVSGLGALAVNKSGGTFQVGGSTTLNATNAATLDLSGLTTFTADLGSTGIFRVGDNNTPSNTHNPSGGASTVVLAGSSIITANHVGIGDLSAQNSLQTLRLGSTSTLLKTNTLVIGAKTAVGTVRGNGLINFQSGTGTLELKAADGIGRAAVDVANHQVSTGVATTGTIDLSGHSSDLLISTLNIGHRSGGDSNVNGTFSFGTGTLDVTSAVIGKRTGRASGTSTGILSIAGGTSTFGSIAMGDSNTAGGIANGTLTLTGGTVTLAGNITKTGGAGTTSATINLQGATLDMDGNNIGSGTNSVTFNAESGTLKNVASINGAGGLTKTTAGTLIIEGSNGYTGATSVTAGKLIVNGNISTSTTTVSSTGTLGGGGTVAAVIVQAGGTLAPGNSIDSLGINGDLTLNSGSFSLFEIDTTGNLSDLAIVSGLLTFGGTLNVNNVGSTLVNGDTFDLFNWSSKSGTFSAVNLPVLDSGLTWDDTALYTTGTLTVVPEPRAALLGGLGLLALLRRRR